ncbi:uncharacterized protein LOC124159448 [Ischnura elegans]|uniref:uncharacterized protein LOC124159448 n=1 Tax=Ischnura elegans TaxID=197161 RepID=UPI001ED891CD|nr:uncharacterized protein LOC124159448 [Ischnura elegans]
MSQQNKSAQRKLKRRARAEVERARTLSQYMSDDSCNADDESTDQDEQLNSNNNEEHIIEDPMDVGDNLVQSDSTASGTSEESDEDLFIFEEVIVANNPQLQDDEDREAYLLRALKEWAHRGVSLKKIDTLLSILNPIHPYLPLTHSALLGTPHCVDELPRMGMGKFWYKGLKKNLEQRLTEKYLNEFKRVVIDINIDGFEPFKSTHDSIWPILGRLKNQKEPFVIATYLGKGKPSDIIEYLADFVREARALTANGIFMFSQNYQFEIRHYILDAPARALVKCIIGHNGYFSCEKCEVEGVWVNGVMTFNDLDAPMRTDITFQNRCNVQHHTGDSPLESIPMTKMISSFRLDAMHLVYQGVMKRWMKFLMGSKKRRGLLNEQQVNDINNKISELAQCVPRDFNRRPRQFEFRAKFHATEYRRILLYDGLWLFKDLNESLWKSFKLLQVPLYILCSPTLVKKENMLDVAQLLLRRFIEHSQRYISETFVSYNVHALSHLVEECRENECTLDELSAFPFENYIGVIKKLLRSGYKPLEQLVNRDVERGGYLMEPQSEKQPNQVTLYHQHEDADEIMDGRMYKK